MIILFIFLLFAMAFIYPAAVAVWFKLNGDPRTIVEIIRMEA